MLAKNVTTGSGAGAIPAYITNMKSSATFAGTRTATGRGESEHPRREGEKRP